jgi:hypothetical protein
MFVYFGGGSGRGLAPTRSHIICYVTVYIYISHGFFLVFKYKTRGSIVYHVTLCYMRAGFLKNGLNSFKNDSTCVITTFGCKQSPFYHSARSYYDPYARGARRLGAGPPITILQFAPLVWLRPMLGFHAIYCVCARFIGEGCVL